MRRVARAGWSVVRIDRRTGEAGPDPHAACHIGPVLRLLDWPDGAVGSARAPKGLGDSGRRDATGISEGVELFDTTISPKRLLHSHEVDQKTKHYATIAGSAGLRDGRLGAVLRITTSSTTDFDLRNWWAVHAWPVGPAGAFSCSASMCWTSYCLNPGATIGSGLNVAHGCAVAGDHAPYACAAAGGFPTAAA